MIQPDASLKEVCSHFNVSRETFERMEIYLKLLVKWNPKINLVSKSTVSSAAVRHFADSLQLWAYRPRFSSWADIGSGAGFPGLALAIVAAEVTPLSQFHLIESDARKCAFLRNVSRETEVPVTVVTARIEDCSNLNVDVVSARALSSVDKLLEYSSIIQDSGATGLFLKGQSVETELEAARRHWNFDAEQIPSETDENGTILRVRNIARVN